MEMDMSTVLQVIQIIPASGWYALMDCRRGLNDDPSELEERPIIAFALCRKRFKSIEHRIEYDTINKETFGEYYTEREEEHYMDCARFTRPILQSFGHDGVGAHGEPYDYKRSELGRIIDVYEGKGNHGLKSLKFEDNKDIKIEEGYGH